MPSSLLQTSISPAQENYSAGAPGALHVRACASELCEPGTGVWGWQQHLVVLSFYVGAIFRCAWVWQTTAEGAQEVLPVTLSFHVRSGSPDKESSSDSAPAEYAGICTRDMIASVFLRSGQSLDDPESLLPVTSTTFPSSEAD